MKVKEFFEEHPKLATMKLSIVEVFSSPTNQGQLFCCVLNGRDAPEGQVLDFDPLNWDYKWLGNQADFKFVQDQQQQ